MSVAVAAVLPTVAVIWVVASVATATVVTGKVPVFVPDATVMVGGTVKLGFELLSLTSTGKLPALAASSTVAVGGVPPGTEFGATVILVIFGVNTLMLEVIELFPTVAVTCEEVSFAVTTVVTGNVAIFAPAAT